MTSSSQLGVLVVEDEDIAARAHGDYVERVDGFRLVGTAKNATQAFAALTGRISGIRAEDVDLVLLDMNLPDGHGLQLLRSLRARKVSVDVIAVTAARDKAVVQEALALGVVNYIIKPFAFGVFASKLDAYLQYRRSLVGSDAGGLTQSEVDAAVAGLHARTAPAVPSGVPDGVLEQLTAKMREAGPLSAAEASEALGVSRVTARRYLERLADAGLLDRQPRYGSTGRPVLEYAPPAG